MSSKNKTIVLSFAGKQNPMNDNIKTLLESEINPNPFKQFGHWLKEAKDTGALDYNAMHLASVNKACKPTLRVVLLKDYDESGFVFFTNYLSRKGMELEDNNQVSLNFYWPQFARQVRIDGEASRVSAKESDDYFYTRPIESQAGALISAQSRVIPDRDYLEKQFAEVMKNIDKQPVKRPDNWGGYRVQPHLIEFWQGRDFRLHDRIQFRLLDTGSWQMERLAP